MKAVTARITRGSATCRCGIEIAAAAERAVVRNARGERLGAGGGDLVVTAWRTSIALGERRGFPAAANESCFLEARENRIDRPRRQTDGVHDVEAVSRPLGDGGEDADGGERKRT